MLVVPETASHNADSMKLDSKFFDRLRVKPDANRLLRDSCPACEWPGCTEPGLYPAPKGRAREGQYHRFCLDHVREYNKSYNYFAGLPDEAVVKHQKDDMIGHRPTWSLGVNSWARNRKARRGDAPGGFTHRFSRLRSVRTVPRARRQDRRRDAGAAAQARRAEVPAPAQSRGQRHQGRHQGALQGTG